MEAFPIGLECDITVTTDNFRTFRNCDTLSMSLIKKILIANRGEIAVRIIKACHEMNISTVAVYSDADRQSLHVRLAGESVHIGANPATESYLNEEKILDAALSTGADAIHPGYGFFAENPEFAESCRNRGLIFIGPPAKAMNVMASKASAKDLALKAKVPVVPGYYGDDQSEGRLEHEAEEIGYPLLIKAAFGGGGKGMRVVENEKDFPEALVSARNEARSSFGSDAVILERYISAARHIEIQVLADDHGNVLHCFERECSVQRRQQKIIEEAPSPFLTGSLRERMARAAVEIARTVDYAGLGTIEFIVEDLPGSENFYFLEMNTRLQVEHGVTEAVTGLDLVRLQLEIAEGRPLLLRQDEIEMRGHAVECRLYAEDPEHHFTPAIGTVLCWNPVEKSDIRVDTGISAGMKITPDYDPLLAKLIAWGDNRNRALRAMTRGLRDTVLLGLKTNQSFLLKVLSHEVFLAGDATTRFVESRLEELLPAPGEAETDLILVAALVDALGRNHPPGHPPPFRRTLPIVIEGDRRQVILLEHTPTIYEAVFQDRGHRLEILFPPEGQRLTVAVDGRAASYTAAREGKNLFIHAPHLGNRTLTIPSRFSSASRSRTEGSYFAAMPGRIVDVLVREGQKVRSGDRLIVMESMKMEHSTVAAEDGMVAELFVRTGDSVDAGTTLIDVHPMRSDALSSAAGE